jgi:hypothetical protein
MYILDCALLSYGTKDLAGVYRRSGGTYHTASIYNPENFHTNSHRHKNSKSDTLIFHSNMSQWLNLKYFDTIE